MLGDGVDAKVSLATPRTALVRVDGALAPLGRGRRAPVLAVRRRGVVAVRGHLAVLGALAPLGRGRRAPVLAVRRRGVVAVRGHLAVLEVVLRVEAVGVVGVVIVGVVIVGVEALVVAEGEEVAPDALWLVAALGDGDLYFGVAVHQLYVVEGA